MKNCHAGAWRSVGFCGGGEEKNCHAGAWRSVSAARNNSFVHSFNGQGELLNTTGMERMNMQSFSGNEHSPWRSRGYMPHLDAPGLIQHITFRLRDALPEQALTEMKRTISRIQQSEKETQQRLCIEKYLDAGHGSCILSHPEAARLIQNALFHFDHVRYRLLAWVIMPNHVHVLIEQFDVCGLGKIVQSWKSFTARRINAQWEGLCSDLHIHAKREQRLWHREYWDRYIRDERHLSSVITYIHENPVQAKLVQNSSDWQWSSISKRFA